ncbi:histidine kinase dimerization/phospho-acceptor domain-containing protein [Blautia massiliensis (ex Durand et al. 2017)]
MSHDIRTPINGICGMLDVAIYADDMDKQRECRTKIKEASNLLLNW